MSKAFNINEFVDGILSSQISYVSKAITLVESTKPEHQEQAQQIINAIINKAKARCPISDNISGVTQINYTVSNVFG